MSYIIIYNIGYVLTSHQNYFIINLLFYNDRMTNLGETAYIGSAEGEDATNSQAKGPNSDETLESLMTPKKQSLNF